VTATTGQPTVVSLSIGTNATSDVVVALGTGPCSGSSGGGGVQVVPRALAGLGDDRWRLGRDGRRLGRDGRWPSSHGRWLGGRGRLWVD